MVAFEPMANPFVHRYQQSNVLIKTGATNLFWLLSLMIFAGLAILALSVINPGITGLSFLPAILLGFVAATSSAMLLLVLGQFRIASWITFISLLLVVSAVAYLSRSGANEMDLFQAVTLYFLGLIVLTAIGVGGRLTAFWVAAGLGMMTAIYLIPPDDVRYTLTIAEWNKEFNPLVITSIYLMGSFAGLMLLIQNRRNLKVMQWDQEIIESTNAMLENTVEERTRALRTILDSSGQGLFTFGANFLVDPDYSAGCSKIFDTDIAGTEADKLLFPRGADLAREFRQGLELYFAGKSRASVIFDLLEKETFVKGHALKVDYRELGTDKVLVVLTDVTLDRQLADRNRADEARRTLVLKALGHKRYFAGLLADAEALFGVLRVYEERPATPEETQRLLEMLHTFKGNCGFFGFTSTQEVAHDFEYAVNDAMVLGEELDYHDVSLDLKRSYYQELNTISDALGKGWLEEAGGIVIPRDVFDKVARYIGTKYPGEFRLVDVMEHYRKMPLKDLFSRFPFVAQSTAEKLGKRIRTMEILGGEIRIVPDRLDRLVSACVHIVNNMVDHGIELPYQRENQGKPPEGTLKLNIVRGETSVVLEFIDDGQGISVPEVEARAVEKGLLAQGTSLPPREVMQFLFAPGFSTRTEVTEVSGRGIGLSAVREEAERLGGRIEVQSKLHSGTNFEIILPLAVFANRRVRHSIAGPERRRS
jgi:two-component system chemotaxis sensor kinase CheA